MDPEIHAVWWLAQAYGARLVPLGGLIASASAGYGCEALCADGLHPIPPGQRLIAGSWMACRERR